MTFDEMTVQVKAVKGLEVRTFEKNYCEVVASTAQWDSVLAILKAYFGMPLKPQGQKTQGDAKKIADPYGGVQQNQTLFWCKGQAGSELALLWPWGSGQSVTVKIIRE